MRYDIIIPHYGITGELNSMVSRCLQSIKVHSSDYRIIFVDNGTPDREFSRIPLKGHPHLLVRVCRNVGFVQAVNMGLCLSTAPRVVIMNNDTEAVPEWLERLDRPLTDMPEAGLSGPRTDTPDSWQGRTPLRSVRPLPTSAMLAFFCVMIKRKVIERVGVLDESYGVGFGDDDDYCYRVQRGGWRLILVGDLMIPHRHRTTFKTLYSTSEIRKMQDRAMAHLREVGHWPHK